MMIIRNVQTSSPLYNTEYEQLDELLREEGVSECLLKNDAFLRYNGADSRFGKRGWFIYFNGSHVFRLDPSLYQVRDPQTIPVEEVEKMIEEMKACYPLHSIKSLNDKKFDSIASRYLHKQETTG